MMKHHVFWLPEADERLTRLLSQAEDASELAGAIRLIDRMLARHPRSFGESRYDNVRIAFESPFGLQFELLEDPPTVIVHDIWLFRH